LIPERREVQAKVGQCRGASKCRRHIRMRVLFGFVGETEKERRAISTRFESSATLASPIIQIGRATRKARAARFSKINKFSIAVLGPKIFASEVSRAHGERRQILSRSRERHVGAVKTTR
jgi:hypothetical protein